MAKDQVEWVSLEDVMVAAERSLAPLGPELAGFIALEATSKLREVGGGVVDASNLAIGTTGYVALTAQPKRGDDGIGARTLRLMLGSLLEVATSSTPALRQCAKRKDHASTAALLRELEGALIPLNRAASRRAVARLARATLEAIEDGRLEPALPDDLGAGRDGEQSDPPPMELAARPRSEPPPLPRRPEPTRLREVVELPAEDVEISMSAAPPRVQPHAPPPALARAYEPTPLPARAYEPTPAPADADPTPFQPSLFEAFEANDAPEPHQDRPGAAIADLAATLEQQGPAEIEIVSQLPPIVTSVPPMVSASANDVSPHGGVYSLRFSPTVQPKSDRVAQLIESFEVSRRRDDKALGRDIKAWIGIETATSNPPPVTVHVKLKARGDDEIDIDHEAPRQSSEPVELDRVLPRGRGGFAAAIALGACALVLGMFAARPAMLDALLGKPLPPPGDTTPAAQPPQAAEVIAPKLPVVCEATLTLEGAPAGSEVLRRVGLTPVTVAMPMNVPFDLVATMEGHAPRRSRVDPTATWQKEPTGARLDVPFALDPTTSPAGSPTAAPKWPAASGLIPLRAAPEASRGLLRATSTPSGASVWVEVDPTGIVGIPCGGPVDLMVVAPAAAPKALRVEWSSFSGAPPRATAKW